MQAHGGYKKHANVAAFMSVFPMNAPRYAVYMMLDEPHATKATYGYATAGWVVAPAAGKVIARIAPMMGMLPDIVNMAAINQSLAIPLEPGRPSGAPARGPGAAPPAVDPAPKTVRDTKPNLTVPATVLPPAISRPVQDIRRQTRLLGAPFVVAEARTSYPAMAARPVMAAYPVMAGEGPPSTPVPPLAQGVDGPPARAMTGWADAYPPTMAEWDSGRATFVMASSVAAR